MVVEIRHSRILLLIISRIASGRPGHSVMPHTTTIDMLCLYEYSTVKTPGTIVSDQTQLFLCPFYQTMRQLQSIFRQINLTWNTSTSVHFNFYFATILLIIKHGSFFRPSILFVLKMRFTRVKTFVAPLFVSRFVSQPMKLLGYVIL